MEGDVLNCPPTGYTATANYLTRPATTGSSPQRWAAVDSNHLPYSRTTSLYEAARANQEFESFLGRSARIAAVSNMWCPWCRHRNI